MLSHLKPCWGKCSWRFRGGDSKDGDMDGNGWRVGFECNKNLQCAVGLEVGERVERLEIPGAAASLRACVDVPRWSRKGTSRESNVVLTIRDLATRRGVGTAEMTELWVHASSGGSKITWLDDPWFGVGRLGINLRPPASSSSSSPHSPPFPGKFSKDSKPTKSSTHVCCSRPLWLHSDIRLKPVHDGLLDTTSFKSPLRLSYEIPHFPNSLILAFPRTAPSFTMSENS